MVRAACDRVASGARWPHAPTAHAMTWFSGLDDAVANCSITTIAFLGVVRVWGVEGAEVR